jgi:hypothetical protein
MAKSLIIQTLGGPSDGVLGLIEISDKIARLSEAGYAFETKRRKLEHQFEVTNSELREEYLAAVLEIHESPDGRCPASAPMRQIRRVEEGRISGSS